jgi:hypothetical protein
MAGVVLMDLQSTTEDEGWRSKREGRGEGEDLCFQEIILSL